MQISDYLKKETARYHDAAEAKFQSKKIFDGSFTAEDYLRLLQGNFVLIHQLEDLAMEVLQPQFGKVLDLENRRKRSALQKDFAEINLTPPENDPEIFPPLTIPAAFGVLYVMEGSTLGGTVMARQLAKNPVMTSKKFHYLGIYGESLGEKWKTFKQVMDENITEADFPEALRGAELAYDILLKS